MSAPIDKATALFTGPTLCPLTHAKPEYLQLHDLIDTTLTRAEKCHIDAVFWRGVSDGTDAETLRIVKKLKTVANENRE